MEHTGRWTTWSSINTYWKQAIDQNANNLTAQAVSIILQEYTQDFFDPSKNLSNFNRMARVSPYLGNAWTYYNSSSIFPTANLYNTSRDPAYLKMTSGLLDGQTYWGYGNIYGRTYAAVNTVIYAGQSTPSHVCQAGGILQESLDLYMQTLVPSQNAVIFLFDALGTGMYPAGTIISTSIPNAGIPTDPMLALFSLLTIDKSWDSNIAQVGKYLRAKYPVISDLVGPTTFKATLGDGQAWYIGAQQIKVDDIGGKWTLVIAFPRSDFFASIDRSIIRSIIVMACLAVAGVLATLAVSFAVVYPLHVLGVCMGEATQMKFKFLEDRNIDKTSAVTEISNLQTAFATMVKAFAAGIRKNASLVSAKSRVGATTSVMKKKLSITQASD
ncbi:uncharacterized protein EV422DRAFT_95562 [Fimicolochytrium jonesii]|uniref:uncharacterized protein n=1 Tax=Fimicolochytrium jonesii TaxID=1396493 RepID=UPI0022FEC4A2|nr:uncharacterized protein EV422DRAFT_95562 [Fimicolochytrium jonesii]KAI8820022.1 hypothetical protein EV422DRAFT_95562 [Fimicolochytrium jonesii]